MKLIQPSLSSPSAPAVSALALAASTELGLVRSGLVAEYRFNEGSGQILYDYSGNNNHGTLGSTTGADTNDPTWTASGLAFATDDYISCGAVSAGGVTPNMYACSVVFYSSSALSKSTTGQTLISLMNCPGTERSFIGIGALAFGMTDEIIGVLSPDTTHGTYYGHTSNTIAAGWHSAVFAWNGSTYNIYIDNVKMTATAASGGDASLIPLSDVYIGAREGAGSLAVYLSGSIAHVTLYNRALTQAEITQNYNYLKSYLLRERGITLA